MSNEFVKYLVEARRNKTGGWSCRKCIAVSAKLKRQFTVINDRLENLEASKIESNQKWADKKLRDELVEGCVRRLEEGGGANSDCVYEELRDRAGHQNNIIIHGEEEAEAGTGKEMDVENLKKILVLPGWVEVDLDIDKQIRFSRRLGEIRKRDYLGPRPLLLGLKQKEDKEFLLANAYKLAMALGP